MIYSIVAYGDTVLRKRAKEIEEGSVDVKTLSENMFETMHNASGVGLAAPQIGRSIRLFVIDTAPMEDEKYKDFKQVFINPEIIDESGNDWDFEEGCLSVPGIRENVNRLEKIRIRYFDVDWKEHVEEFDGIAARIIQHEFDHLEGILFTDYLTGLKKRLLKGKLAGISKGDVKVDYVMKFPKKKK
ncbi:MAG: peptide deformylase [Cyclobacteriaceae bacterium]|nr:peptide deformylase [Cyclobacteriaceae bacterium]